MRKIIGALIATSLILASCILQTEQPQTSEETPADTSAAQPATTALATSLAHIPAAPASRPNSQPQSALMAKPRVITVESGNLYFKPSTIRLKANQKITINFTNKGFHTFTIKELGVDLKLTGATRSVTFTPNKKGTFPIICAVLGHAEAGMVGKVVVE